MGRWAKSDLRIYAGYDTSGTGFGDAALALAARIDSLNADGMVAGLFALALDYPRQGRSTAERILGAMGGARALALLRTPEGLTAFPGDTTRASHPIRVIAGRLEPPPETPVIRSSSWAIVPDSQLAAARAALKAPFTHAWLVAFQMLTESDPAAVVDFFEHKSVPPARSWSGPTSYTLGAYFGWRCGADRAAMLRRLLRAQEPVVRVSAAVYLAYEDSAQGARALHDLTGLKGFSGGWAATVLASRGDARAMDRALQVFDLPPSYADGHHYAALQARLLVLLSNSATSSGLEQPPASNYLFQPRGPEHKPAVKALRGWWKRVRGSIQLRDPWLREFARQKVD